MTRLAEDLSRQLDDDTVFITEALLLKHWMESCIEYLTLVFQSESRLFNYSI